MRIGFDAKRALHNFRGLGNYSRSVIEGVSSYSPENQIFLYSPTSKDRRAQDWLNSLGTNTHLVYPDSFLKQIFHPRWRSHWMTADILSANLSLFHGLSHELPLNIKRSSTQWIVTIHDLIFLRYPHFYSWLDRQTYLHKIRSACTHADVVIAICSQTKEDLINFLKVPEHKIKVHFQSTSPIFYNHLESAAVSEVLSQYKIEGKYILNVGAFEGRKNQLNLLEAFFKAKDSIEENLVLIGEGKSYKRKIEQRIIDLNLQSRVKILSGVNFKDLPAIYQGAQLFCFPSLFEGFGIPITEALFSGTPVLTSIGSCFPESAGPNSEFVDPLSVVDLSDALTRILNNNEKRLLMSSKGLEYCQQFHTIQSTAALMKIYNETIQNA
jgi:glycosyltransferase involved in cell wall biosynthesis